jgi:hypothetical protein
LLLCISTGWTALAVIFIRQTKDAERRDKVSVQPGNERELARLGQVPERRRC